jgi:hypothetical protein
MHPREIAACNGERTYEGQPCKTCGSVKRYTINASCVDCSNERSKQYVKKRREHLKALLGQSKLGA